MKQGREREGDLGQSPLTPAVCDVGVIEPPLSRPVLFRLIRIVLLVQAAKHEPWLPVTAGSSGWRPCTGSDAGQLYGRAGGDGRPAGSEADRSPRWVTQLGRDRGLHVEDPEADMGARRERDGVELGHGHDAGKARADLPLGGRAGGRRVRVGAGGRRQVGQQVGNQGSGGAVARRQGQRDGTGRRDAPAATGEVAAAVEGEHAARRREAQGPSSGPARWPRRNPSVGRRCRRCQCWPRSCRCTAGR